MAKKLMTFCFWDVCICHRCHQKYPYYHHQNCSDKNPIFDDQDNNNNIHHDQDLINVDYLKGRMSSLLEAFPEPFFNHAMAVKVESIVIIVNPLISFANPSRIFNNFMPSMNLSSKSGSTCSWMKLPQANSIRGVMTVAKDHGLGAECASLQVVYPTHIRYHHHQHHHHCHHQEAKHALSLGFPPNMVVFDSPVKTPKVEMQCFYSTQNL